MSSVVQELTEMYAQASTSEARTKQSAAEAVVILRKAAADQWSTYEPYARGLDAAASLIVKQVFRS